MSRTNTTFNLLQATAAIVAIAILFWSFGLPSMRFAQAANVTNFSNTLSDSAPSAASNHTITFVTPTGVAEGETITLDFSDGPFNVAAVDFEDIDVYDDATLLTMAADCTGTEEVAASFSGTVLTITFCAGDGAVIPQNGTSTIMIGNHTSGGAAQIVNPAATGSFEIGLTAGADDVGTTLVAIVAPVVVEAAVDATLTFTVDGVATGTVNGAALTGTTSATEIPFGVLTQYSATTSAQQLSVATNATYGFVVTVQVDQQLTSASGADIDGFLDGSYVTTPIPWESPTPVISDENTWGHWGLTTDDETVDVGDPFDVGGTGELFVSASTTPVVVFRHNGPADGTTQNIGTARVGYRVEISPLQEAATDYTATLTYVATPVF